MEPATDDVTGQEGLSAVPPVTPNPCPNIMQCLTDTCTPSPCRTSHPTMASSPSHTASPRQTCIYITHHGMALVHTHAELHAARPPVLTQILAHRYKRACAPRPELTDTVTGRHCHRHRGWCVDTQHPAEQHVQAHTHRHRCCPAPSTPPSMCWHSECGRRSHGSWEGSEPAPPDAACFRTLRLPPTTQQLSCSEPGRYCID